jgi:hypothetical protein
MAPKNSPGFKNPGLFFALSVKTSHFQEKTRRRFFFISFKESFLGFNILNKELSCLAPAPID